jgi:PKD repeat protein
MGTDEFPLIEVSGSSAEAAGRLKGLALRFRAEDDPGWYEVPFQSTAGAAFHAVLPKPLPEAVRVRYYIVAQRPERRSSEYMVNVLMGGCPGARVASAEQAKTVRVRRTSNTQTPFPKGFSPEGTGGGGMSGTTLGIIAGAAGGAGIAAALASGGDSAPTPPDTGPEAIRACFTPDPIPDIDSGGRILFDASCSTPQTVTAYEWNFGDGTTGRGSSVEHLFTPGGTYTVTLTVRDGARNDSISRVLRVRATPAACFITSPDPPRIHVNQSISFNADCSVGDVDGGPTAITSYLWDFGDGDDPAEGRFVSHLFGAPDLYGVTLTVTNEDGRQDRTTQFVVVERRSTSIPPSGIAFTSALELPPGANGQIAVNQSETLALAAPAPQKLRLRGRSGENLVEGRLLSEASGGGQWRFDFRDAEGFLPGSLRVDSGDVLSLEATSLVFRVTGKPGPPIRFRFRVSEGSRE